MKEVDDLRIRQKDYELFHELANAYYREGEDADTPQEEIDAFIRFLFEKVIGGEIGGCFAKDGGSCIGFALWAMDTEDFAFSRLPGFGTILEIGLIPACRGAGRGKALVRFAEDSLRAMGAEQCYVCAYGPARNFWAGCGYGENGATAANGLKIMTKNLCPAESGRS